LSKVALEQLTPIDLFGGEVLVGFVLLGAIATSRGTRPGRPNGVLLALGLLEPGISFVLFDLGLDRTAATHAALLLATETLFTVALAALLLRERLNRQLRMSLIAGVLGSVLVAWQSGGAAASLSGDTLVVGGALAAAGYAVLARHVAPERDPIVVTAVQMLGALMIAVPVVGASIAMGESHLARADVGHLAVAASVGLLASVVPFLLFNIAIARVRASLAGLILALVPVFGTVASLVIVGEALGPLQAAGGAIVVLAAGLAARHSSS
jgi:drug/metabolite transporter (DMT)-like permease